jgi:hypothetical protein
MLSTSSDLPAKSTAVKCGIALAATVLAVRIFRTTLDYRFGRQEQGFLGPSLIVALIAAFVVGLGWFGLLFVLIKYANRPGVVIRDKASNSLPIAACKRRSLYQDVCTAGIAAIVLASTAWLALGINDEEFYSRLTPWVGSLIWLQEPGFTAASRLFPCRSEGFVTGCESYKWIPTFLLSNAIAYIPVLVASLQFYRYCDWFRKPMRNASSLIHWVATIGASALCLRLFLYGLSPDVSSSIHAHDPFRLAWIVADNGAGIIATILVLLVPFYGFRAFSAVRSRQQVRMSLVDMTWLASFLFAALALGNQFAR